MEKVNEEGQAQEEDITDSKPGGNDGLQVAGGATSAMHDLLDLQQKWRT